MNLPILAFLAFFTASLYDAPAMSRTDRIEIRVPTGEFVLSVEGGVRMEMSAAALARLEDGSIRVTSPATFQLTASREFQMSFTGPSTSFEIEIRSSKAGAKSVRATGSVIRLEGNAVSTSILSAASIQVMQ